MMKILKHKKISILFVLIWMSVIFYLSHQHAEDSSELSSGITASILNILTNIFHLEINREFFHLLVRKGAHFTAYFILGLLLIHALQIGKGQIIRMWTIALSFIVAVLYAISDEVHQLFIPGRSGEIRDVLLDSSGALTGIIVYILLFKIIVNYRRKKRARNTF